MGRYWEDDGSRGEGGGRLSHARGGLAAERVHVMLRLSGEGRRGPEADGRAGEGERGLGGRRKGVGANRRRGRRRK